MSSMVSESLKRNERNIKNKKKQNIVTEREKNQWVYYGMQRGKNNERDRTNT